MLKYIFACALCLGMVLTAAGCAGCKTLAPKDLENRRFVLASVDGKPFKTALNTPDIQFGEGFRVSGGMCNRYMGQGKLVGNVLTVSPMASTRMLCPDDELDKLETLFGRMLEQGAEVSFDGNTLSLKQGGNTLVFTAGDWI